MPNIKPISALRNYTNVINEVKYRNRVYLTKNGHRQIAMIDMRELDELERELALYRIKLGAGKDERSLRNGASMDAFERLKNLKINVPYDFDEKKELLEALDEKYGSFD